MLIRRALEHDLPAIVQLLATDRLGKLRENFTIPLSQKYIDAFREIDEDPNVELIAVVADNGEVIGTFQMTFLRSLIYQGGLAAQIEAVRIRDDMRGKGLGKQAITWAIARAKEKGAHMVQLTSHKDRTEAIAFYEKLGFKASHEGMKLKL